MYAEVLGIVSHARRKLIRLIEARRLAVAARSYGIRVSNIPLLYRMAVGRLDPSFIMIFNLRQHIAPVEWFYDETEKLPEKREFQAKYSGFDRQAWQHIIRHPTVAVAYLEEIFLDGRLPDFCAEQGFRYAAVYRYAAKKKRYDGIWGYPPRPGYKVIREFRDIIHPDDWFIFPEEKI
jgi:hypothetical protein